MLKRFFSGLSTRLQLLCIFLSLVGVAFGIASYVMVKDAVDHRTAELFYDKLILQIFIAIAANIIVGYVIMRIATRQINNLSACMRALTEGDLDAEVPYADDMTEIGSMARKVQRFKENALEKEELEKQQAEAKTKAEEDKKKAMKALAQKFEDEVQGIIDKLSNTAKESSGISEVLVGLMRNALTKANEVGEASKSTSQNVNAVASAAKELSSSINEISEKVSKSRTVVKSAVTHAEEISKTISTLLEESKRISEVVVLINSVAKQINLLALNATIESSRAGEAGKGFAVVASEVKNLAQQTANAIVEISQKIRDVQEASNEVASGVSGIIESINNVAEYSSEISAAISEQAKSTGDIAKNMVTASSSTNQINESIAYVSSYVGEASGATSNAAHAAKMSEVQSKDMHEKVSAFLNSLR